MSNERTADARLQRLLHILPAAMRDGGARLAEEADDGSVFVRRHVNDPHWAVGHALAYGAEAEVVEPSVIRAMVREVAGELAR